MSALTVSERLVEFMHGWRARGLPANVLHEANRLVINQLKASVGATDHPAMRLLHQWAHDCGVGSTRILWFGTRAPEEQAVVINGALFEILDFHDTYIPCFMHAVSAVLPAALAAAELSRCSGREFLTALALGIEVELACARLLMPSGYYRGFVAGGITGPVGAAAAAALLSGLDRTASRHALGIAMSCGVGTYQGAGFMSFAYVMGHAARSGLTACRLAALGIDAPAAAFEGDKGMLSAYSDESADRIEGVLESMGSPWCILGQSYKTVPTETITHAPLECVFAVLARAGDRTVERMRFGVAAIVVQIADERRDRFGNPSSELTAKFDLRFCAAAAWVRRRFGLAEMRAQAYNDPTIMQLRARIDLVADASFTTFNGAALEVSFTDGSTESARVADFRGTPQSPLSDAELSTLFCTAAAGVLPPGRAENILACAWALPAAQTLDPLLRLLSCQ